MTEGLTSLKLVLKAISLDFPDIGYSQGMNYLIGFLLITSGGNEKESFWIFKSMAENKKFLIKGLYEVDHRYILIYNIERSASYELSINTVSQRIRKEST